MTTTTVTRRATRGYSYNMSTTVSVAKERLDTDTVIALLSQSGIVVNDRFKEEIVLSMDRAEMRQNSNAEKKENEVYVYGPIISGISGYLAKYFNVVSVSETVKEIRNIKAKGLTPSLFIDSPGGSYFGGVSIASAVRDTVADTKIDGLAASAASVIFMAGDKRSASKGAQMMVHRPRSYSGGTSSDLRADAKALENIENDHIENISELSSLSLEDAKNAVHATTWYRVKDMKKLGFLTTEEQSEPNSVPESGQATNVSTNEIRLMRARLALAKANLNLHKG